MAKNVPAQDDDGQQVRVQMQISEIASPELYVDLRAMKVMARRYRLIHLATLGLLMERSMLQGGINSVPALTHSHFSIPATPAQGSRKPTKKGLAVAKDDGGSATLDVPSGFGDALVEELHT